MEPEFDIGPGIEFANCSSGNGSLHWMWTMYVGLPGGCYLSEFGGQGGCERIVMPRVRCLRGGMSERRSADELAGRIGPPWRHD